MSAFFLVSSQWRASFGSIYALDYTAVKETLNAVEISFKQVLPGLQVIEQHIVHLANKAHHAQQH